MATTYRGYVFTKGQIIHGIELPYVLGLFWLLGNDAYPLLFFFLPLPTSVYFYQLKLQGCWVRIHQRMSCRGEGFTTRG